ncbi:MAG: hypothetical protein M3Z11_00050 [Candidatus Dormibacteraeota bacterium]|nr:hypothetical protein [Candidatus Dormibacteraeota bacterium]
MLNEEMGIDERFKGLLDFSRLMDGENRASKDPDDVDHWRAVYADLVGFKHKMLADTHQHIASVPASEKELGKNDVPFLEAEMERLQRGLEFWENRRKEIGR